MKRLILISAVVYSLLAIAGNFSTHSISASGESKLYLTPSAVNAEPGKRFDISVIASSPSTYNSAQIDIKYNPENLNLIEAKPGNGLPSIANNEHDPDKGLINFTLYKIGGTSGNADLLNMTFEGVTGTSDIALLDSSVIVDGGTALVSGDSSTTVTVTNSSTSNSESSDESSGETDNNTSSSTDNDNVVESNSDSNSDSNSTTPKPTSDPALDNTSTDESSPTTSNTNVDTLASQENLNSSADTNQAESTITEKSSSADELPNTGINNVVALASMVTIIGYCINVLRIKCF